MTVHRVLIVDDTASLLKLGVAIFESGGYEVITATNGVEALDQLSKHNVDLIVTDILMPDMDGYSLCFSIRNEEKFKKIPIIIYSATYTSKSDEELGLEVGANMFIRKPASMDSLLEAAAGLIAKPSQGAAAEQSPELSDVMRQYNSRLIEKLEEKNQELLQANRLYAFISAINQCIVHVETDDDLLAQVCDIAITIGHYKMAWIGMLDEQGLLQMVVRRGHASATDELKKHTGMDFNDPRLRETPTGRALHTGKYAVSNDVQNDPTMDQWAEAFIRQEIRANISLPLIKSGRVIGVLGLNSTSENFFDDTEIMLLEEAVGDISFALEILERSRYQERLRQDLKHKEIRLNQAQAIAHFGSWELSFATGTATWSAEACRIYGLPPEENVRGFQAWLSFIHPDDIAEVMNIINESQKTLSSYGFHHRIIRADQGVRHIYSEAHFEFDSENVPIGLHGIAHDITEKRQAEYALARSEANLRLIMDQIPQSIFVKDHTGKYLFVNKSFSRLYGRTPESLENRSVVDSIPSGNEADDFLDEDKQVMLSGKIKTIPETKFTDQAGTLRYFRTIKVPFTVADTNERAIVGIAEDITEQKKAEEERNQIVADIIQRNADLEQFSYIVSHNLRAPVANILGLAELIVTVDPNAEDLKLFTRMLTESTENLDNVVRDLNQILQVREGAHYQRSSVSLSALFADIINSIDDLIKIENVTLTSDFTAADELVTIKSYMHSIFYNLISNSIRYRRPEVPPHITVSSVRHGNSIELIFKDNGLGMNLQKIEGQLFGLYKRFHDGIDGKGMGLYMVKTQVQILGGTITVSSTVNEGTEFRIVFASS